MEKKRRVVCVIFGAQSREYDVSLKSAYTVLEAVEMEKYIIYKIGITRDGRWLLFTGENVEILKDIWYENPKNEPICVDFEAKCFKTPTRKIRPEAVFPALHGEYGEDGRVQSVCELLGISCVGVSSVSAVLCMDKLLSKTVAMRELVPVVPFTLVKRGEPYPTDIALSDGGVFVKPTRAGSSIGISRARNEAELSVAIDRALEVCDEALIEMAIKGSECEVALLEINGEIIESEVGEISYSADFYDYQTKYHSKHVKYKIPAKIPEECRILCRKYAIELFRALGVRGMARVDFFVCEDGQVYFNEINAIPGFTEGSMYPMLMAHAGYSLSRLIDALIEGAE